MQKDDIRTKKLVTFALLFWIMHYALLEMAGATYANVIGLLRMYFSLKHKGNKLALSFTLILTLIVGIVTYDGLISVLPIIASFIAVLAYQMFRGVAMRLGLIIVSLLWLYYNFIEQSIPGMVNDFLSIIILVITMIKIYIDEHKKLSVKQTFVQRIKYIMHSGKARKRRDFGRFTIFRDRKKYLEDNNIVYED